MMKPIILLIQLVVLSVSWATVAADQKSFHSIPSEREGAEQPFWLIEPDNATHSVILFAGGSGVLDMGEYGIGQEGNFLVRTRSQFAAQGLVVAVVDRPTDRKKLFRFRTTKKHAKDIKAVILFLQERHPNKPIWLVGTSRGTISVANIAARFHGKAAPDGIVLTSSVTRKSKKNLDSLEDIDLSAITAPTYIVHHEDDECKVTPYDEAKELMDALSSVEVKEFKGFSGGRSPGKPCKGKSYHGFMGIEDEVVKSITDWIKAH